MSTTTMTKPTKPTWITRKVAAEFVGLSPGQFDDAIRPLLGGDAVRGRGKTLEYLASAVVAAHVRREVDRAKPPESDDAMLAAGVDSPALERYRMARAQLAERDLAERDANLLQADACGDLMRRGINAMRGAGEKLTRRFGNDAGTIYNEAIDEFVAAVNRTFGD